MKVRLEIQDPAMRMTLAVMLKAAEASGSRQPQVTIADTAEKAVEAAAGADSVADRRIRYRESRGRHETRRIRLCFPPLQPGKAALMVERAAGAVQQRQDTLSAEEKLADVERRQILRVLRECKGNKVKAAKVLGMGVIPCGADYGNTKSLPVKRRVPLSEAVTRTDKVRAAPCSKLIF